MTAPALHSVWFGRRETRMVVDVGDLHLWYWDLAGNPHTFANQHSAWAPDAVWIDSHGNFGGWVKRDHARLGTKVEHNRWLKMWQKRSQILVA